MSKKKYRFKFGCKKEMTPDSCYSFRPNKKISVFRVTGLKILGKQQTNVYFFFSEKNITLCILKDKFAFQNASKLYFFQKT